MAQAMASISGLRATSQGVLEGSLSSNRFNVATNNGRVPMPRSGLSVRAAAHQGEAETSRRAVLGLVAAGLASGSFVQNVLADAIPIKVGPPPPPSGGLPGTLNSDQARDVELPLGQRFYLQPKTPAEAAQRVKDSAKEIVGVKQYIDKKAWPYVMNDLRTKAEYLRFDLKTVISALPKEQKQGLKDLTQKLLDNINNLDHAAKVKSTPEAEKYYAETVSTLNDVLSKLG